MPPLAKQEKECDKYTKVTIYVPSDEEKQTESQLPRPMADTIEVGACKSSS